VTLPPAFRVPDDGDTVREPSRVDGSEIDQDTGPPLSVSVSEPPSSGLSTTVAGETDSVATSDGPVNGALEVTVTGTEAVGVLVDGTTVGPPIGSAIGGIVGELVGPGPSLGVEVTGEVEVDVEVEVGAVEPGADAVALRFPGARVAVAVGDPAVPVVPVVPVGGAPVLAVPPAAVGAAPTVPLPGGPAPGSAGAGR
jgi:hypothetical protein